MFCNGTLENVFLHQSPLFLIPNPENLNSNHVTHTKLHTPLILNSCFNLQPLQWHAMTSQSRHFRTSIDMAATIPFSHSATKIHIIKFHTLVTSLYSLTQQQNLFYYFRQQPHKIIFRQIVAYLYIQNIFPGYYNAHAHTHAHTHAHNNNNNNNNNNNISNKGKLIVLFSLKIFQVCPTFEAVTVCKQALVMLWSKVTCTRARLVFTSREFTKWGREPQRQRMTS